MRARPLSGYCAHCDLFTREEACFVCGSGLLYGIALHVTGGNHRHDPNKTWATIGGKTVQVLVGDDPL